MFRQNFEQSPGWKSFIAINLDLYRYTNKYIEGKIQATSLRFGYENSGNSDLQPSFVRRLSHNLFLRLENRSTLPKQNEEITPKKTLSPPPSLKWL